MTCMLPRSTSIHSLLPISRLTGVAEHQAPPFPSPFNLSNQNQIVASFYWAEVNCLFVLLRHIEQIIRLCSSAVVISTLSKWSWWGNKELKQSVGDKKGGEIAQMRNDWLRFKSASFSIQIVAKWPSYLENISEKVKQKSICIATLLFFLKSLANKSCVKSLLTFRQCLIPSFS